MNLRKNSVTPNLVAFLTHRCLSSIPWTSIKKKLFFQQIKQVSDASLANSYRNNGTNSHYNSFGGYASVYGFPGSWSYRLLLPISVYFQRVISIYSSCYQLTLVLLVLLHRQQMIQVYLLILKYHLQLVLMFLPVLLVLIYFQK
jgi:hypothetical protein